MSDPVPFATPAPEEAPRTPAALHAWLVGALDLHIPRTTLVSTHTPPFDYLCHTFFEGEPDLVSSPPHRCPVPDAQPLPPLDAIVWANRGGGKTFLGAVATALDLIFKPEIEIRILGGSMEQSKRMHAHLRALFTRPLLAPLVVGRITDRRLRLRTGSEVELLAQSHTSVRGARVQKLRCDEVELFDPDVWEAAQLTTRSKRCGEFHVRGTIECLSTMHLAHGIMFDLLKEAAAGKRRLFKWGVVDVLADCGVERACRASERRTRVGDPCHPETRVGDPCHPETRVGDPCHQAEAPEGNARRADCPLLPECAGLAKRAPGRDAGHVPIDDAIRMKSRVGDAAWRAEMLCDRPRRTDAVLPEFDPRTHVVRGSPWECSDAAPADPLAPGLASLRPSVAPPTSLLWLAGMDFGFRAPTVVLWAALDERGTLWIVDERVVAEAVLDDHIGAIRAAPWPAPAWIGVDPAGRQTSDQTGLSAVTVLKRAGLGIRDRRLSLHDGIALVRARLKPAGVPWPTLFVHERCVRLIESLERYHYPADRPESLDPVKDGHDHAADALRYLVTNLDRPPACALRRYA